MTNKQSNRNKLIKLDTNTIIYARPYGQHYHLSSDCLMVKSPTNENDKYTKITIEEVINRKLNPCECCYTNYNPNKQATTPSNKINPLFPEKIYDIAPQYYNNYFGLYNTKDIAEPHITTVHEYNFDNMPKVDNELLELLTNIDTEYRKYKHYPKLSEASIEVTLQSLMIIVNKERKYLDKLFERKEVINKTTNGNNTTNNTDTADSATK